uniref:Uncharacterized protein n=1 Tax=Cacopsylla melanoneura TaxID=428564 RepID=A0A8D9B9Y2_9HEMI
MSLVLATCVSLALSLYPLVVDSTRLTPLRYFRFVGIFFGLMSEFFITCNSSEQADNCYAMVRNAIHKSSWAMCTNQTRRYLCILLRRVQRANHLRVNGGVVVLSRPSYIEVVKVAYTFVNFMRSKTPGK